MTCTCNCKRYVVLFIINIKIMREIYGKMNTSHRQLFNYRAENCIALNMKSLTIAQNELYLICGCMLTFNEFELVVKSCFSYLVVNTFGINSVHLLTALIAITFTTGHISKSKVRFESETHTLLLIVMCICSALIQSSMNDTLLSTTSIIISVSYFNLFILHYF